MHIKSILSAAAIALAASVGSAYAADQFAIMEGIAAQAMTTQDMGLVTGKVDSLATLSVDPGGGEVVGFLFVGGAVSGLIHAVDRPFVLTVAGQSGGVVVIIINE